ncbi:chondroitin proteoglycan-2-like [Ruditapes philippinarum]|uniref:chondroitin proteoglycan-2-like n=1 Tax=Ruditapes philippinarum TaxID=129788 RepID=UPI00295C2021|nr:chondroitin proteoglycan-2-like [Ruditapes philippinarum]
MNKIVICTVLLSAFVGYASAVNCTTLSDGNYELGCKSFAKCVGGVSSIVDCPEHNVYNNNTGMCDDPKNVAPPCGNLIDCSSTADGQYADKDQNCATWYTCNDKKFLGHNFCPSGTVFDESLHTCNWIDAVPPPCGTKSGK